MSRYEQMIQLALTLQGLQAEERIDRWLREHAGRNVETSFDPAAQQFRCRVYIGLSWIASGNGESESDARAQAFSKIFLDSNRPEAP